MKNKSARHKELNTFKFQHFSERLSNIDIDVFHRVEHEYETESDEQSCYFHQDIEKWNLLNLTEAYEVFKREIKYQSLFTLPQLILHKDRVVEVLLKHLSLKNTLCLQPLLSLTVSLAKDLQKDFHHYYYRFFEILLALLNSKDTDLLEWTFTCLAYLFKFLWRFLIKDVTTVFNCLLPLLSENKPEYINNFAAESFAFVARKVKDRKSFLVLILKGVRSNNEGIPGCGKLLFEVIKGIDGRFHSCADEVLPFLFGSLSDEKLHQETLFQILEHMTSNIVQEVNAEHFIILWSTLFTLLDKLSQNWELSQDDKIAYNIDLVLKILGQCIEYKNGRLLKNNATSIQHIGKLLSHCNFPEYVLLTLAKISILLLTSSNIRLAQEEASLLTRKILSMQNRTVKLYFVDNIDKFSSYEALILPNFLQLCIADDLKTDAFRVLTNFILKKSPLCENGMKLSSWIKYPLDFRSHDNNSKMEEQLLRNISSGHLDSTSSESVERFFCTFTCIPHMNLSNINPFKIMLKDIILGLVEQINSKTEIISSFGRILFLLNNAIECLIHIEGQIFVHQFSKKLLEILLPLGSGDNNIFALNILSLLFAVSNKQNLINMEGLNNVHRFLEKNVGSPIHEVRLLTTYIYTRFEKIPEFNLEYSSEVDTIKEDFQIFSLCHRVECIDPLIHTYREQIQCLEKLSYGKPQMIMCNQTPYKTIPLRYLCGTLYINFKLLWEPVTKIIESHAHGLEIDCFWQVFSEKIKAANEDIKREQGTVIDILDTEYVTLGDLYQKYQKISSKVDYQNYRLLLWQSMALFADVAEAKTRDISGILLDFVEHEYVKYNSEIATMFNIKQSDIKLSESVLDIDEDESKIKHKLKKLHPKSGGESNLKTLIHYLTVFSKIRSPKSMYRESDLQKLYLDLLQHRNAGVQKLALDCIMTYKYKYLTPYRDNLYNLIDDKNFKNELSKFNVNFDGSTIQSEHRELLIPIVLKIVFSKMSSKVGLRTGGKSTGQLRRTLIFRFLAGCEEKEMLSFVHMAFRYYDKYMDTDPEAQVENISKNVNLEKFIPPKRLQSTINMLNVVLEQFGGLMGSDLLTYLFNIALTVGASIKGAFSQVSSIHSGYLPALKTLRTSIIKVFHKYFGRFDKYVWNSKQINALFNVIIWPYLDKLNIEGIHSPTSLLKLITLWGSNPRYFPLLVKHQTNDESKYILPHVMQLLNNVKSHGLVVSAIMEMIENLVSLQADEEDLQLVIPIDNLLPIKKNILDRISVNDKLNYGSCILLPHVPSILSKLQKKLENKSKHLNQRELFILSRVSELVWEADISDNILKIILPVVLKRCDENIGEDVICQYLTTIKNLLQNVEHPDEHLKKISPLFGEITQAAARKLLTSILEIIAIKAPNLDNTKNVIYEFNAWDVKWLDQPDFQRRHDAFKHIQTLILDEKIDLQLGILIVYNCFFFMKSEKDLSLKENSSHCLKTLCPFLLKKFEKSRTENEFLLDTIFNLIRNGMKNRNTDFRNECISLLGALARECPENHFILRDLNVYTNKNDMEVDFFENLVHLQLHRHARALLKFCQIVKEQTTTPNPRTLTQFILPLASYYLCCEKYSNKNSVVDAAIETIGIVCRILPWHHYEGLLKFYLGKLRYKVEYQRQLVRLIVTILDAFHYDLHKGYALKLTDNSKILIEDEVDVGNDNKKNKIEISVEEEKGEDVEMDIDEALNIEENDLNLNASDEELEDEIIKISNKTTVLCKSTSIRVTNVIKTVLLPQLHRALAQMTHHESSHKTNRKTMSLEREEEDLLRVPISLAVVKLLQKLPVEVLDVNLPGIFMKTCTFLKSHLDSVRRVARETLQNIMLTLGPSYLPLLFGEMAPLLSRGFQVHVLVFTIHGVLNCLKDVYKPNDIDKVLLTVVKLCRADLFGTLSEEKEVIKITVKVSEAKSTKSLDTFQILAKFITDKCLMDLLLPVKDTLETTNSFKIVNRAHECLRHIALGLVENNFISTESLLKFAYGAASESIPQLLTGKKRPDLTEKERNKLQRQKPDCFIIPKGPVGRSGFRASNIKLSANTNAHLLVDFGLRLCLVLLKRDKLKDEAFKPFMDPFVVLLQNCITSKHIKLVTTALQCTTWILRYDLPSMREHIKKITLDIFGILHKYAASGLTKGDNFDMVAAAFKAMSVLVRDVKYHIIEIDQLKVLLLYVEQDMYDHDRQATAFNLLKSIIARKLITPEIHEIMNKVAELSITSELEYVRAHARLVFHQFLMEYPLGKKLEYHLSFYMSQLSYELQFGRESALSMIQTLINSFPVNTLKDHSGTILITLGARLVNEEVPECKKMVADCLTSMIIKLPKADREPLFEIIILWFKDRHISHRRLAAQLCGIFVVIEKSTFEKRLPLLNQIILKQFGLEEAPGRFVKVKTDNIEENEETVRVKDHHYFQVLQLLLKLCANCPNFIKQKEELNELAPFMQTLLNYPHDWVRLAACQFLGYILSDIDADHLGNLLVQNESEAIGFLVNDPKNSVKSLTLDLCDQLIPGSINSNLAEQVIKNLVFIARVLQNVPIATGSDNKINLLWLTKRIRKIVNTEVVEAPQSICLRTEVFKWIAGISSALEEENLSNVLHHLLAPLVREMITTEESNAPLRQLAKEVGGIIKKRIGLEKYTTALSKLQQNLSVKRAERKRSRTQLAVTDPEMFAKKKIKNHEKKRDSKKRKIAELKGTKKNFKRRKTIDLDSSEIM